jgi:hypothetical protein
MVGVGMGVDHAVEPPDARVEQLARADLARCRSARLSPRLRRPIPFDQERAAAAGVARICRGRNRPNAAEARHTARGAAAQDGEAQFVAIASGRLRPAPRPSRVNRRSKLAVVWRRRNRVVDAEHLGADARGMHGIGRLVALAAIGRGGKVGAVGFHRICGRPGRRRRYRADRCAFGEGGDARTSTGRTRDRARSRASMCAGEKSNASRRYRRPRCVRRSGCGPCPHRRRGHG